MRKSIIALIAILLVIVIIACTQVEKENEKIGHGELTLVVLDPFEPQDIQLTTEDDLNLAATYYPGNTSNGVILMHMLNKDRQTYDDFALKLQDKGYHILSIDMRGHGESDLKWKKFSDEDFKNMVLDAKAAKQFLTSKNIETINVIGASIGANTALIFSQQDPSIAKTVLLSPGLEYRGINIESAAQSFNKPLLVVAAEDDAYSAQTAEKIKELNPNAELNIYESGGHGTNLFRAGVGLEEFLIGWLED